MASYHKMLCTKSLYTTIIKPSATKNNYVYSLFMAEYVSNKPYCQNSYRERYFLSIPVLLLLRGGHYGALFYHYAVFISVLLIYSYTSPLPHAFFIYLVLFFFS